MSDWIEEKYKDENERFKVLIFHIRNSQFTKQDHTSWKMEDLFGDSETADMGPEGLWNWAGKFED